MARNNFLYFVFGDERNKDVLTAFLEVNAAATICRPNPPTTFGMRISCRVVGIMYKLEFTAQAQRDAIKAARAGHKDMINSILDDFTKQEIHWLYRL